MAEAGELSLLKAMGFGLPSRQLGAAEFLPDNTDRKTALRAGKATVGAYVRSGESALRLGYTETKATVLGSEWRLLDYGDTLPAPDCADLLRDEVKRPQAQHGADQMLGRNQCLLIALSAAALRAKLKHVPPNRVLQNAALIRSGQLAQSISREQMLCQSNPTTTIAEAELRAHIHDATNPSRDRDYQPLLRSSAPLQQTRAICAPRVNPTGRPQAQIINSAESRKDRSISLVAHLGSAPAALPLCQKASECLLGAAGFVVATIGRGALLQTIHSDSVDIKTSELARRTWRREGQVRPPSGLEGCLVGQASGQYALQILAFKEQFDREEDMSIFWDSQPPNISGELNLDTSSLQSANFARIPSPRRREIFRRAD